MMNLYPNRRHQKAMDLTTHVAHVIAKYLPVNDERNIMREITRELEILFYTSGVDVITEADRIQAGLMPRDHNGLTLEEIRILDARFARAMLEPVMPFEFKNEESKK